MRNIVSMGNQLTVSTTDYDNNIRNTLKINDVECYLEFNVNKQWFIIKLTNQYQLVTYEITNNSKLDIKYFNICELVHPIKLVHNQNISNIEIKQELTIKELTESNLRNVSFQNIATQIEILTEELNSEHTLINRQAITSYLNILKILCPIIKVYFTHFCFP